MVEQQTDVVLVSMPFASYKQPSLALSLLKGGLAREGIRCRVLYFTLQMADMIGDWLYDKIGTWHLPDMLGDWIFADYLSEGGLPSPDAYLEQVLQAGLKEHQIVNFGKEDITGYIWEQILELRSEIPGFLHRCAEQVLALNPRVVGLTSGVHQHVASLALARALKDIAPSVYVVLGGPNVRGIMGYQTAKSFPFIDAVVSGEGEVVFPEMVHRVLKGQDMVGLAGVFTREQTHGHWEKGREEYTLGPEDLDDIPYPDYNDFIEQWEQGTATRSQGRLLVEGSRGCFWGEKVRCVFCGQASPTLKYRGKSPGRFATELQHIHSLKPGFQVCITDEAVPADVIQELAETFGKRGKDELPDIVYVQVRPDLTKGSLEKLCQVGVRRLEVGIETLNTRMLKLMRKGMRGLKNIAFLKWCRELGIEAVWNMLWGFPGEPGEAYRAMAAICPLLFHLDPPNFVGQVRLERFSPMFEQPAAFGITEIKPYPAYMFVYDLPEEEISNLAYYFAGLCLSSGDLEQYTAELADVIDLWKRCRGRAFLNVYDDGQRLTVIDGRSPFSPAQRYMLDGLHREIYLQLDEPQQESEVINRFEAHSGEDIKKVLTDLTRAGLVLREGESYLNLGIMAQGPGR